MSQENVEPVRQRLSGRERPARTRTIEERLAVRFPWLAQGWSRLIVRLSPATGADAARDTERLRRLQPRRP
jgi:hypothetical protein